MSHSQENSQEPDSTDINQQAPVLMICTHYRLCDLLDVSIISSDLLMVCLIIPALWPPPPLWPLNYVSITSPVTTSSSPSLDSSILLEKAQVLLSHPQKNESPESESSREVALRAWTQPAPALNHEGQHLDCPAVPWTNQVTTGKSNQVTDWATFPNSCAYETKTPFPSWSTWHHCRTLGWFCT